MIFFKWFLIFDFFGLFKDSKNIIFAFSLSVPLFLFLIHYKPLAIPKHKSYYNVYNIYINIQLHFTRQLLQAFQDLQQFRFCSRYRWQSRAGAMFYIFILHYAQHNYYFICCQLCNFNKSQKNQKYFKKSVDNSFNLCYY